MDTRSQIDKLYEEVSGNQLHLWSEMCTMKFEEIDENVEKWFKDRGALEPGAMDTRAQIDKLCEEVLELLEAYAIKDTCGLIDAIGDCMVVLKGISLSQGHDLKKCYELAEKEIRHRKGKWIKGKFVKET